MAGDERLRGEIDAGYFASLYEVTDAKLKKAEVGTYIEDLAVDYSFEKARGDIDADSLNHSSQVHLVDCGDELPRTEEMATELMTAEDRAQFIKAEKDAIQAEVEAAVIIARAERFMNAARNVGLSPSKTEEGEE